MTSAEVQAMAAEAKRDLAKARAQDKVWDEAAKNMRG